MVGGALDVFLVVWVYMFVHVVYIGVPAGRVTGEMPQRRRTCPCQPPLARLALLRSGVVESFVVDPLPLLQALRRLHHRRTRRLFESVWWGGRPSVLVIVNTIVVIV